MLANPTARERLSKSLADFASAQHQSGIVVDFELRAAKQPEGFLAISFTIWRPRMHAHNLKLMVALPAADWSYDYKYLAAQADAIILMNYDLHWPTSDAGPIAPQDWFERNIDNMVKIVPAGQNRDGHCELRLRLAGKIQEGSASHRAGLSLSSRELSPPSNPNRTSPSIPTRSIRIIPTKTRKTRFTTSGCSTASPPTTNCAPRSAPACAAPPCGGWARKILRSGPSGTPRIPTDAIRAKLEEVPPGYDLILEGDGDIWRITATPQSGRRTFDYDASSDVFDDECFQSYPLSWRIQQMGAAPHKVALTFDDGPDPEWTPKILDILKRNRRRRHFS